MARADAERLQVLRYRETILAVFSGSSLGR